MRVFLADDHPLFRIGLKIALDQEEDIEIAGEASDGFGAVEKIQADPPDLSLIDMDMPGISGIRVIRILRKTNPDMRILVLSTYDDEKYIEGAMQAGADGYVLKCVEVAELVRIIRAFCNGLQIVSPYLVNLTLSASPVEKIGESEEVVLTQREKEILKCIIDGQSNKEISNTVCISVETVKSHVKNLYQKLQVKSRVEAAMIAMKKDLL
ncbi:MAG: response regulator transcription factor [Desulforhabdus sp.]|nr:response regulator transcription factor [Desulforhabdus sp.]